MIVGEAKIRLCIRNILFGGLTIPLYCFEGVFINAFAFFVCITKISLSRCMSLFCCLPKPHRCLNVIYSNAFAFRIRDS